MERTNRYGIGAQKRQIEREIDILKSLAKTAENKAPYEIRIKTWKAVLMTVKRYEEIVLTARAQKEKEKCT